MASVNREIGARYDDLPYSSYAYPYSAPEQLAAVAALFGMPAPALATARILELGGASGGNLIPFALRHPQASAVGVDISGVQVEEGRKYLARLGAGNVSLIEADFLELDPASLGKFDYIIAHGVYSWVSPEAQEAVLRIIGECLLPDGIAFVSYNTYPGWKAKEILRDAMLMHGGTQRSAQEQVAYGRAMVGFLQKVSLKGGLTATALNENSRQILESPVSYVAHDYLEPYNLPCYFHEFVERTGRHGLAYLAEAQPSMMMPSNYGPELAQQLYGALGEDQVRVEQYLDFAISRSFRQTLLLHAERAASLGGRLDKAALAAMHFAARLSCVDGPMVFDGRPQDFVEPTGARRISASLSAIKRAIEFMADRWPGTATRGELIEYAGMDRGEKDAVPPEVLGNAIDELLEILVIRGMARMRLEAVEVGNGKRGLAVDPLVLRQLAALAHGQNHVTNAWHDTVDIGEVERLLFPAMDGSRGRPELLALVAQALQERKLSDAGASGSVEERAERILDVALASMRDSAVLSAAA
jgi:SAM-dependent methyltransferase